VITAKYTHAPKKVRFEEQSDTEPPSPVPPQEVIKSFAAISQTQPNTEPKSDEPDFYPNKKACQVLYESFTKFKNLKIQSELARK